MFETQQQREAREKAEAWDREARVKAYEKRMGVELPYSPVAVVERPKLVVQPVERRPSCATGEVVQPKLDSRPVKKNAAWWREYRKREKKCPHCGGAL